LYIHPGALAILCGIFLQVSQKTPVLLTTHSPEFLERVPTESVRVVEMDDQGITRVGPLAADQVEVVHQKLFTVGELMRIEGLVRTESRETVGA
jgi:predicted ATPase